MTAAEIRNAVNSTLSTLHPAKQTPVRLLKIVYLTAICSLVALTFSSHWTLDRQIKENQASVRLVDAGGSLKTSSQRIALLARNLVASSSLTERENIRKEILNEWTRIRKISAALEHGDPDLGIPSVHSAKVKKLFYSQPVDLKRKIEKFLEEARSLAYVPEREIGPSNPHLRYLRKEASGDRLLADLETLMAQYQVESETKMNDLGELQGLIFGCQILVLIITAVFVFKPLADRVGREIDALNTANDSLEERIAERTAVAEQRAQKLVESERLAFLDPLTEVLNRRGLQSTMAKNSGAGSLPAFHGAVLLLDLDDFKAVNDRYGHATGDHVLREVAQILKASVRSSDIVCRIGGDEFLILLPGASETDAVSCAEKVRAQIEKSAIYATPFDRVAISASFGAITASNLGTTLEELLRSTHSALYRSKHSGKNRVSYENAGIPRAC